MTGETPSPCGLYVHLPWCVRKCPYCDFNSYEGGAALPFDAYVAALKADLAREREDAGPLVISSVFFGGGTPSLFPPAAIESILAAAAGHFVFAADAEITLEANPGSAEAGRFAGYREAGVTRLSIGVQSFHDDALRALGRIHDGQAARAAIVAAQRAGFPHLNLDLMYGLPGQQWPDFQKDLATAVSFAPDHLSLYELTCEPNTPFGHHPPERPDDDVLHAMEDHLLEVTNEAGFRHYEVSAFARAGGVCRHNRDVWEYGDLIGVGAGAHGKRYTPRGTLRTRKPAQPARYLATAGDGGEREILDLATQRFEVMLNGLRLIDGLSWPTVRARAGLTRDAFEPELTRALADGLLHEQGARLWPSDAGRRWLNDLQARFLPPTRAVTDR